MPHVNKICAQGEKELQSQVNVTDHTHSGMRHVPSMMIRLKPSNTWRYLQGHTCTPVTTIETAD